MIPCDEIVLGTCLNDTKNPVRRRERLLERAEELEAEILVKMDQIRVIFDEVRELGP